MSKDNRRKRGKKRKKEKKVLQAGKNVKKLINSIEKGVGKSKKCSQWKC